MKLRSLKDPLKWVAAACALVATASAEYELARAIGMNPWVALAVPGALDAYVVRALRAHREVLTSVLAMVGVNAVSHLLTAGVLVLDWRIITAVSAIAPLVLWRVHALGTPGEWRRRTIWGVLDDEHGRDTHEHDETGREHPVPEERFDSDTGEYYQVPDGEHATSTGEHVEPWIDDDTDTPPRWNRLYGGPPPAATETCDWCGWAECPAHLIDSHKANSCVKRFEHGPGTFDEHVSSVPGMADLDIPHTVPEEWTRPEHGEHAPFTVLPVLDDPEHAPVLDVPGSVLTLPVGFVDRDWDRARVLDGEHIGEHGEHVPVRVLKTELRTGTPRATRLRHSLEAACTHEHAHTHLSSEDDR